MMWGRSSRWSFFIVWKVFEFVLDCNFGGFFFFWKWSGMVVMVCYNKLWFISSAYFSLCLFG